jgi:hypothetical protein
VSDIPALLLMLGALLAMRLLLVVSGWLVRILIVAVWICLLAVVLYHAVH